MAKSQESFNKKEKEKKKRQKQKEKEQRKEERKSTSGKGFDDMIAYVDDYGNITSTPPDPSKKREINVEDIEIGTPKKEEYEEGENEVTGVVTFFNETKGFGFIKNSKNNDSYFVHVNDLIDPIKDRDKVSFETEDGPRGVKAIKVKKI